MEQTLPDYLFWYCPLDKNCLQWTGRNFTAIFSLLWPKKGYFWHQRHKILNFEIENMVKNGANSLRLCVLILPFRWNRLQWTGRTFTAIFSFYSHKKGYFCHQRHNILNFWNKKHGQKWSTLYQTMCIDTALQIKIVYSGLVIILLPLLAFYCPKKGYFCHQMNQILNFERENMVKNGANSIRLCVLILPLRWKLFTVDWL